MVGSFRLVFEVVIANGEVYFAGAIRMRTCFGHWEGNIWVVLHWLRSSQEGLNQKRSCIRLNSH